MFMLTFLLDDLIKTNHLNESQLPLKRSLEFLPPADRLLLIPMAKEYTAISLTSKGINSLANSDWVYLEATKAATKSRWKIRIITAELDFRVQTSRYDYDIQGHIV